MSQLFLSSVLTSALALCGGVSLLVAGAVITRFFIEPIQQLLRLRGKIANDLIYYANVIASPGLSDQGVLSETREKLRRRAAQLLARSSAIPWCGLWQWLRFVPASRNVEEASMRLIYLSNSLSVGDSGIENETYRFEVLRLLGHVTVRDAKKALNNDTK